MGLLRLLFWIAVIFTALWLWRRFKRRVATPAETPTPAPMVRCAHCGIHVPQQNALTHGEHWYCSQAHQQQGLRSIER